MPLETTLVVIERVQVDQFAQIWPIFHAVVRAGDTYPYPPDTTYETGKAIWFASDKQIYMATHNNQAVGTYYLKPNQIGLGSHVANAGFMVSPAARGLGVGKAMGRHALEEAKRLGYTAMQFNLVVETNTPSIKLWESLGFEILTTVPKVFAHAQLGLVGAHIMYRTLEDL